MNAPFRDETRVSALGLELDLLRTFVAIFDTGSFKDAAELVFRTPSAVSMQVKKLEEIVGRSVFKRDARGVTLTPDGEVLLAYARRLIRLSDEAIGHFRAPAIEGVVRLGAPDDYGSRFLPGILKRFAATHPRVVVDVVMDTSTVLRERVRKGELDLTLMTCGAEAASEEGLEVVFEEQLVWAGAKGGCAHTCEPLPVSMWEEGCPWRSNAIAALNEVKRDYRVAYMSAHSAGQKAAVIADLAVAPFPRSLVEAPLVELTQEHDGMPPLKTYFVALYVGPKAKTAALVVADHVKSTFKDQS